MVVALGSNLAGEFASSETLLEAALARFPQAELPVLARSGWWSSAAWPDPMGPEYRNGVALVEAKGGPQAVLQALFSIETHFGRDRRARNAARTLDLDLLDYNGTQCVSERLVLPHPRLHERRFVLAPLAEIAPQWRHPRSGKTATELLAALSPEQQPVHEASDPGRP